MMIIQGDCKKGDLLPSEKEIMDMTGVSRITVRGALKLLNEAGIIQTQKGRGSVVMVDASDIIKDTSTTREYVQAFIDSTRARIFIEPEISKEAALRATDEEIELLEKALYSEDGSSFHNAISSIVHNPVIDEIFEKFTILETDKTLVNLIPSMQQTIVSEKLHRQHQEIFDAIRDKKADYAYFYAKRHREYVYETYLEYFRILF